MAFINAINKTFTLSTGQILVGTSTSAASTIGLDVGQVLIGNGLTVAPTAATLTAGTGITLTNAAGAITINSTASSQTTSVISVATTAANNTNYVITNTSILTLPTPTVAGERIRVVGTAGGYTVQNPTGVTLQIGSVTGAAAGSAVSQTPGDALELISASTTAWVAYAMIGTFNLT